MMASPDFSTYVDLTPFDTTVTSILEESITQARALIPSWEPRVGQMETTLLEATAHQTAVLANSANRLPASTVETLLKLYGVTRSNGVKSTAKITINFTDTAGYTVPISTPFAYYGSSGEVLVYMLDAAQTVSAGSSQLTLCPVTAQAIGSAYNGPPNGSTLQVLATIPYISSVVFDLKPSGGFDAESDDIYFSRAITTLAGYSSVLATESQIQNYVLANYATTGFRAKAYNKRRFADRNMVTGGGEHTAYVLLSLASENVNGYSRSVDDATLLAADLTTISTAINAKIATGLSVEVHNAELVGVGVTLEVYKTTAAASGTVNTAVQTALKIYLDSDAWDWDRVVRLNEIISLVDGVTGVDYVKSVTLSLPEETVACATIANMPVVYDNGTAGVGATVTNSGTQAAFTVDGVTPSADARILVKDQSTAFQNGIYTLTTVGDGSSNWVLTRAADADVVGELCVDKFVWVTAGTANGNEGWSCSVAPTIMGAGTTTFIQTTTAVRAEVMASNATDTTGALTGDIRMNHLGMLTYPSTLTVTVT
ncbi:MAG: hypothetical protein HOI21_00505 [Bacteroidetes Order II. Incertae sedis bacterium]|jgi:hypothetical protein|nr:hypothetical protein [Bacteroidetes Order II. bacterium]